MSSHHFVHDSASRERQHQGEQLEAHRDLLRVSTKAALETSRIVDEKDLANLEKQSGQRLGTQDFEQRCQKLVPSLKFDTNHLTADHAKALHLAPSSTCRRMYRTTPEGPLQYLGSHLDQAMIPEFQVMLTRTKRLPALITDFQHVKAQDGSWVRVPCIKGSDIPKDDDTTSSRPGEISVKEPAGCIPGWRTVLAKLVGYGLTTPEAVEREFGSPDNLTWAIRMGRRAGDILI